ncbi:zinc finger protein 397-like isoform X2 [Maniola hyperantus]|uniref:zinc finger protein 397-like isoform X2 n=1 Tax=Aphantopus hyperantus TaxID=2795564 RepID=UPI003747F7F5
MESDDCDTYIIVVGDGIDTFPECLQEVTERDHLVSEDLLEEPREDSNLENPGSIKHEPADEGIIEIEVPQKEDTEAEFLSDDAELSDDGDKVPQRKIELRSRTKKRTPAERHSFVKSIRNRHPELRKNKKLLINSLVAIMKETKPPPLPKDYFMMDGIMFQCIKCSHQSESISAAGRHYQEKHGERYLYCLACGVNFRCTTNLYKHEKTCEAKDATLVLRARSAFLSNRGRARPVAPQPASPSAPQPAPPLASQPAPSRKRKHPPKKFDCQECSASFALSHSLTAHAHMHAGRLPYVCNICLRGYTRKITLDVEACKEARQDSTLRVRSLPEKLQRQSVSRGTLEHAPTVEAVRVRRMRQAVRAARGAPASRQPQAPRSAAALRLPTMPQEVCSDVAVEGTHEKRARRGPDDAKYVLESAADAEQGAISTSQASHEERTPEGPCILLRRGQRLYIHQTSACQMN